MTILLNYINKKHKVNDIKITKTTKRLALLSVVLHFIAAILYYNASNYKKIKFVWNFTSKMQNGNLDFVQNKCEFKNCFLVKFVNGSSESKFDAVLFDHEVDDLPENRSANLKYIFRTLESPANNPVCGEKYDNFFNLTWTYKLDSDIPSPYFTIYDLNGNELGPKRNLKWLPKFNPINEDIKIKLKSKTIAAAWFVSNCYARSGRDVFVDDVQKELEKFGHTVDIYGKCGPLKCSRENDDKCFELVQKYYYFYFAFENSFAEDYVTEKVLIALNNYAVPVVFGGANYSRFLPPGSYLDGKKLGAEELAKQMNTIMKNKTMFYDFFRWRNHYEYRKNSYEDDVCKLCAALNDRELGKREAWEKFRRWWNGEEYSENCFDANYLYD